MRRTDGGAGRRLDPAHRRALIHVPTLYAAYTPRNGNAISTVVHGYSQAAAALGISSFVLVSDTTGGSAARFASIPARW